MDDLTKRVLEMTETCRRLERADGSSAVTWAHLSGVLYRFATLVESRAKAAPEEAEKPVLTEWRREDGQIACYVVGQSQFSMCDEAVQVQPWVRRGEVAGFNWYVYADFGEDIQPIKEGHEATEEGARSAALDWIRANPSRVPFRLPEEAPLPRTVDDVVQRARGLGPLPSTIMAAQGEPARPSCPETCETEIDRLADRVLRGHRDTVSPEVAERVRQRVRERIKAVWTWAYTIETAKERP